MIKFEHPEVWGWKHAIRGMRNPLNSWDKSDSSFNYDVEATTAGDEEPQYIHIDAMIGYNDLDLMRRLIRAGSSHRKFLRQIFVSVDITAPQYWWSEMDTYKVGTVANSCSKMHKMLCKPFEMSDFSFDQLPGFKNEIKHFRPEIDEENEHWADFGEYRISDCGRVMHSKRLLSGSVHRDNYIFTTIRGKQYPIHRLVAKLFIPNPENKPEVNHIDGNKMNNAAYNLEWVTRSENQKHAVENGLQPKATTTYRGKFTAEQREEIKRLWDSGKFSRRALAKKYQVSHSCINSIVNDKYKYAEQVNVFEEIARPLVDTLNELRDSYLTCENDVDKKRIWYAILQLLPQSYNQRRTVTLTYENLLNMVSQRRGHKLDEWHDFCDWVFTLPYAEELLKEGLK